MLNEVDILLFFINERIIKAGDYLIKVQFIYKMKHWLYCCLVFAKSNLHLFIHYTKKKRALSILLFIIGFYTVGQADNIKIPTVIPSSPASQTLMKYIDYPVSYSAGLPIVNIPLFTIESKALTLPISLSYHASGFKPNEKDNLLGQGWTLNVGGRITRQIKKTPDEFCIQNKIKNETEFPFHCYEGAGGCLYDRSDPEVEYLARAANAYGTDLDFDTEYDIFYYECPNSVSGKFCFERNDQNKLLPITLPYSPIVVIPGDSLVGKHQELFKNKLEILFLILLMKKAFCIVMEDH